MKVFVIILILVTLQGCTSMLLGNTSSRETRPATEQRASQSAVDSTITASLRQQYNADSGISNFMIGIRSVAGRVVLTGTVGSYDIRDRVVDIAHNLHGVVSVDSRVVVNTNL